MLEVIQSAATRVTVFLQDSTGDPATGLSPSDVVISYLKSGEVTVTSKSLDSGNFNEVDTSEMPGLYEVGFTAAELDTLGEFVAVLQSSGVADVVQANIRLKVVVEPDKNKQSQFLGWVSSSGNNTVYTQIQRSGKPVVGLTDAMVNKTTINPVGSVSGTLNEIGDGWYSFLLASSEKPVSGDIGHLTIAPEDPPIFSDVSLGGTTATIENLYGYSVSGEWDGLFAVGNSSSSGYWRHTTDGGENWTTDSFGAILMYAVEGDGTANNVIAVGESGIAYIWDGTTFQFIDYWGSNNDLHSVTVDDATNIWACGLGGEIIFYDGTTASAQTSGTTEDLFGIHSFGNQTLLAVGGTTTNGPIMLESTDGGTNWTDVTTRLTGTASDEILKNIQFDEDDPDIGVVIGARGTGSTTIPVYYTEDQGATWTQTTFTTSASALFEDAAINAGKIFAVGSETSGGDALIYETSDRGTEWSELNLSQSFYSGSLGEPYVGAVFTAPFDPPVYFAGGSETFVKTIEGILFDEVALHFYSSDELSEIALEVTGIKGSSWTPTSSLKSIKDDTSGIVTDIGDIKGGGSFVQNDHSLPAIRDAVDTIDFDLSPATSKLDALLAKRRDIPYTGTVEQNTSATITLKIDGKTNVIVDHLNAVLFKNGTADTTGLMSSWQEVDPVEAPGVYRFTLTNVDTDTLGDLLVVIAQDLSNAEFAGIQYHDTGVSSASTEESNIGVSVKTEEELFVIKKGDPDSSTSPALFHSTDTGESWSTLTVGDAFSGTVPSEMLSVAVDRGTDTLAVLSNIDQFEGLVSHLHLGTASDMTSTAIDMSGAGVTLPSNDAPFPMGVVEDSGADPVAYFIGADNDQISSVVKHDTVSGTTSLLLVGNTTTDVGYGVRSGNERYNGLYVVDDQTVYVVGSADNGNPMIIRTTDGGASWSAVYMPGADGPRIGSINFDSTGQYGYATGAETVVGGDDLVYIYHSSDGGSSWTKITPSIDGGNNDGYTPLQGVHIIDQNTLVFPATVDMEVPALFVSEDGGTSLVSQDLSELNDGLAWQLDGIGETAFANVKEASPSDKNVLHYVYGDPVVELGDDLAFKFNVVDEVDFGPVTDAINEVKGSGFDSATDSLAQLQEDLVPSLEEVRSTAARIAGLVHDNARMTDHQYNDDGLLVSATLTTYPTKSDAEAQTNPKETYKILTTYDEAGRVSDYRVVRES